MFRDQAGMFVGSSSYLWLLCALAVMGVAFVIGTKLEMTPVQSLGGCVKYVLAHVD
jgi:hypothetical protein